MILEYPNKKSKKEIFRNAKQLLHTGFSFDGRNILIKGDNVSGMKYLLDECDLRGKIDLVYIDPPFATNSSFSIGSGRVSTMSKSSDDVLAYSDKLVGSEFLEFLRERLFFLRELLSERGSIYLHIDYKIGHYVRVIMDEVFGTGNFRNDITRIKCNPKNFDRKAYGNIKDMILFYSKTQNLIWNDPQDILTEQEVIKRFNKIDKNGRRYTTIPLHAPGETQDGPTGQMWRGQFPPKGRHWRSSPLVLEKLDKEGLIEWSRKDVPRKKIFADEKVGKKKQDIWEYKDPQYPIYPTEKNSKMLRDIISASSFEESIVLDCFCGSGGTLLAAQSLGRKWIGIDQSEEAIKVTRKRLGDIPSSLFGMNPEYRFVEEIREKDMKRKSKKRDISHIPSNFKECFVQG